MKRVWELWSTRAVVLAVGAFVLSGCATGYVARGLFGGYSHFAVDEDEFVVNYLGNVAVTMSQAEQYALRRAAELTLGNGARYFVITGSNGFTRYTLYTSPVVTSTTGSATSDGRSIVGASRSVTSGRTTSQIQNSVDVTMSIRVFADRPNTAATVFDARLLLDSMTSP